MGFEVFRKTSAPLGKVPSVTIQKRGLISMNRAAHALIDETEHVELLFDAERQVIGLRPTDASNPDAYPVRSQNTGRDSGPVLVAGGMFTRFYKIDTEVSRRWTSPGTEDGVLVIPLDDPGARVVTGNRAAPAAAGDSGG